MVSATVPLALPFCPDAIAIHASAVDAVHAQPASVATSTVSRPPVAPIASDPRLNVKTHAAAACDTTTAWAPTATVVDRGEGAGLAATVYGIDASPWPPAAPLTDTQVAADVTDHVQSRAVVIASDPWPPAAANADGALLTLTWHLSPVGALSEVCVELQLAAASASATAATAARARKWQRIRFSRRHRRKHLARLTGGRGSSP